MEKQKFPYTSLRLPMVNSERDHFHRLYNYILRLKDGGPILAPSTPNYPLRHVYADDVLSARRNSGLIESGKGKGETYNISQDETFGPLTSSSPCWVEYLASSAYGSRPP